MRGGAITFIVVVNAGKLPREGEPVTARADVLSGPGFHLSSFVRLFFWTGKGYDDHRFSGKN